ncbi:MAG: fructosamine kinase family protein [Candidatus Hydrogenedentota bacterium]
MSATLSDAIEAILGDAPHTITPLSGGSVGEVYRAQFSDRDIVVKVDAGPDARLNAEGWMLEYLSEHSTLPVPRVLHSSSRLLLMEMLPGNSVFSGKAEDDAATHLARLHEITAPQFGLERDTLIGSLHQPNPLSDTWIDFFREHRLLHMAREGVREGKIPLDTMSRIEKFASRLEDWLIEPAAPSLLHGDVWTTNVLSSDDRITGFIDPAVYYGHPEIELAFVTLFGTFGTRFFDHYKELRGLEAGFFEERKDIYNLYPLLVHVRLFGGSYLRSVESTIARFGF